MIENKQVLVTGGAGFIGSNLCENLLEYGNKVACMDNFLTGKKSNIAHLIGHGNFTLLEGDIRNPHDCNKATDGIEIVLHQAALGSVPRSINDP
ncbi:MAG: SDR family NAD(P)-dependent oxidoreductase, partial [Bacteroidota bacterium]|nr:SDR family NAD(P)-dependent oxidoreductase [Bacteroidota bacterium]